MLTKRFRLMLDMEAGHFDSINSNSNIDQKWNIFFRNISDRTQLVHLKYYVSKMWGQLWFVGS